jgi:hypothetical protein
MSSLSAEDLIFYSDKDNNIYSGGFNVNSIIMKNGSSPIATLNQTQKGGDNSNSNYNNVSDLFQHLVVPNWTFTLPIKKAFQKQNVEYNHKVDKNNDKDEDEDECIDEDLHSKLLSLIAPKEKEFDKIKTKTKKNKNKIIFKKNKTKKFLKK